MKQLCGLVCVLMLVQPARAQPAMEKAEKRLADLLTPGRGMSSAALTTTPVAWPASKVMEVFVLPVRPYLGLPVRLPAPGRQRVPAKPQAPVRPWDWLAAALQRRA